MAVTITKKFWNSTDLQYDTISKIVFTSPNIDSPAAAGTRSHILPGSAYIGSWYEAVDKMHRIKNNQNIPTGRYIYFDEFTLLSQFDFDSDTYADIETTSYQFSSGDVMNYSQEFYCSVSGTSVSAGTRVHFNEVTGSGIVGVGEKMYVWKDGVANSAYWAHSENTIMFKVTFGEAYNCRLTAWDDDTHSTTANKILDEEHYKVVCAAYKAGDGTTQLPMSASVSGTMIYPPGLDIALKGNSSYYGDFDLIYVANGGETGNEHGNYLIFIPRLHNMTDAFSSGNYDFVTTLHYQYT